MCPRSLTTRDRFYGADSPETVQEPFPYYGFYDDARFRLADDTLTIDFTTYPADAAEPARQVLRREHW